MMYSMLQTGYDKWTSIPSAERELWFRQFAVTIKFFFKTFLIFLYFICTNQIVCFLQQEFTWDSGLTETVRQAFSRKAQTVYTKQIYEWKQVWLDERKPRLLSGTVWTQLIQHWEKEETIEKSLQNSANRNSDRGGKGIYVHNLGACSMSSKEDQLVSFFFICLSSYLNNFLYALPNTFFFRFKKTMVIPSIISSSLRRRTPTKGRVKFRIR